MEYKLDIAIKKSIHALLKKGRAYATSNSELRKSLQSMGVKLKEPDIRFYIKDLRNSPLSEDCVLSCNDGYYFDASESEAEKCMIDLNNRILETKNTLAAIKKQFEAKYRQQANLFLNPMQMKIELNSIGFVYQGAGHWHQSELKFRIYYDGKQLGRVSSIYDTKPKENFYSIEELRKYIKDNFV
jgi:hypothetical protein